MKRYIVEENNNFATVVEYEDNLSIMISETKDEAIARLPSVVQHMLDREVLI